MQPELQIDIIASGDGSPTLYLPHLNETYHSRHGAVQESRHVFIEAGLRPLLARQARITLLEIGFGTGLNALLTLQVALQNPSAHIAMHSLEPYPLPAQVWQQLSGYAVHLGASEADWAALHTAPWGCPQAVLPNFELHKEQQFLERFESAHEVYDLVYFDAFAPSKQPEMWSEENLGRVYQAMLPQGLLVSYCAKGSFKRALKACGFAVEALPGPPGKREMTRAVKI